MTGFERTNERALPIYQTAVYELDSDFVDKTLVVFAVLKKNGKSV